MTTATRPRGTTRPRPAAAGNPLRPKALGYLRDFRVLVGQIQWGEDRQRPVVVRARIAPAPEAPGLSEPGVVELSEKTHWAWACTRHPESVACSCRLAVQMVTGWEHLGGRSTENPGAVSFEHAGPAYRKNIS